MEAGGGARIDNPSRLPPTFTMAMVASQTQALEAGGSSGGPPSTISSARKHKRPPVLNHLKKLKSPTSSQLKRPAKLIKQKQPAAKIFKPPMVGNKLKSPMVTRSPVVTGSPMMRLVVSPVVMGPRSPAIHNLRSSPAVHSPRSSPTVERSPCPTASPLPSFDQQTRPTNDPGSTSTQIQPRKLRSDIWKDMDPIYHAGKLLQARCQRCNESVSLSYWTSSSRTFRSRTHSSSRPSRKVFVKIGCDNCPIAEEWEKAYAVCRLLNVFKKATEVVSGSRYPTSNLYFHQIWRVKQELDSKVSSKIPIIGSMVPGMKAKFDKYWMISYLSNCIPVILDPRFKFGFVEFRMKQAFGNMANVHIAKVDEAIRKLYND